MTDASKTITSAELAKHTTASDCWMVIEGKVYNVTEFLDEHPGGEDVLLAEAGKDATEAFDDVGHSDDARHLLVPMLVGNIEASSASPPKSKGVAKERVTQTPLLNLVPFLIVLASYGYQCYVKQQSQVLP